MFDVCLCHIIFTFIFKGIRGLCIPSDYQKYDLPSPFQTTFVTIGVNLKDIPKVRYYFFLWVVFLGIFSYSLNLNFFISYRNSVFFPF